MIKNEKPEICKDLDETFTSIVRSNNKITIPCELAVKHDLETEDILTLKIVRHFRK